MKILINRTDAIGDTLLTLPICEAIKTKYPDCKIVYLSSDRCLGLFDIVGNIDEHWVLQRDQGILKNFFSFYKKIKELNPDVFIHLGGLQFPILINFLLRTKKRLGLISKIVSFVGLNYGTRQKRSSSGKHEVTMNLEVLRPLGIDSSEVAPMKVKINRDQNYLKENFDSDYIEERKNIFIHPGMTGHTLNWPVKNYVRLAHELEKKYPQNFQFILSFTPSDQKYIDEFKVELKNYPIETLLYLDGAKRGLTHYAKCLLSADLFIGPSTGTTHLANVLNRPVLGLYSPIAAQSSTRWRPYFHLGEGLEILEPSISSLEEVEYKGLEASVVMENITVAEAIEKAEKLLKI